MKREIQDQEEVKNFVDSMYYLLEDHEKKDKYEIGIDETYIYAERLITADKAMHDLVKDKFTLDNNLKKYDAIFGLKANQIDIFEEFPTNKFSPYAEILFKSTLPKNCTNEKAIFLPNEEKYNFLKNLKEKLTETECQKKIKLEKKKISKNKQSLLKYIKELFEYRSKILVVRIDCSYQRTEKTYPKLDDKTTYRERQQKKIGELAKKVTEERSKLLKALKNKYKTGLVGYVWKLEYGERKGFHYHMFFFFDGSIHQEDINIAKEIGETWKNEITNKRGLYWNCNANKDNYAKNGKLGIGAIKHNDKELRANLEVAAKYLTKSDYFINTVLPNGTRTFGKGATKQKKKQGRPRKS